MKEIINNDGGRRLQNEDLDGIQKHILAFQSIFSDETPFVLSGVSLSATIDGLYDISNGYVWLGGRVRKFGGKKGLDLSQNQYINTKDWILQTMHTDGIIRTSKTDYSTVISTTGSGGSNELRLDNISSIRRYYDVNGDKFLKLESSETQSVYSELVFSNAVDSNGHISTSVGLQVNGTLDIFEGDFGTLSISSHTNILGEIRSEGKVSAIALGNNFGQLVASNGDFYTDTANTESFSIDSVTNSKIAALGVTTAKIDDNAVQVRQIDDNSVYTDAIIDSVVTTDKINDLSVDEDQIADYIDNPLIIRDGAVTEPKLSFANLEYVGSGIQTGFNIPRSTGRNVDIYHHLLLENPSQYIYKVWIVGSPTESWDAESGGFDSRHKNYFTQAIGGLFYDPILGDEIISVDLEYLIYKINVR